MSLAGFLCCGYLTMGCKLARASVVVSRTKGKRNNIVFEPSIFDP